MVFMDPPKSDPPDNISKAFYEIGEYTRQNYRLASLEMQEMIFCVAYTLYAKEKKAFSNWYVENDNDHSLLSKSHKQFCNDSKYRVFCEDAVEAIRFLDTVTAKAVITQISSVVVAETSAQISTVISDAAKKIDQDVSSVSVEISRIKSHLEEEKRHNSGMFAFFRHSFSHAFHILFAATIIFGAARIVLYLAPFAEEQAVHHLAPILNLFSPQKENLFPTH